MAYISQIKLPSGNTYDIKDPYWDKVLLDGIRPGSNPSATPYTVDLSRVVEIDNLEIISGGSQCNITGTLRSGYFTTADYQGQGTGNHDPSATGQIIVLYTGYAFASLSNPSFTMIYLSIKDQYASPGTNTLSGLLKYHNSYLGYNSLKDNAFYTLLYYSGQWYVVGDLSESGEISGLDSRVSALESGLSKGIFYTGAVSTAQSTSYNALTDGSTATKLVINGTTCTFTTQAASTASYTDNTYGPGAIVLKPASTATRAPEEYIWDGTTWQEFGAGGSMGDLAFYSTTTASYKPAGAVGSTLSGTAATISAKGTPAGSVTSTFSGTQATLSAKGTPAGTVTITTASATTATANYIPAGTVSFNYDDGYWSQTDVPHINSVGTLPTTKSLNVTTGVSGGKFVSSITSTSIGKVTGVGTLPTTADQTFVTNFDAGDGAYVTEISTVNIGKVTGIGTLPAATYSDITQVTGLTAQTVSTAQIYQMNSTGSVTTASIKVVSGVGSTPTSESKTFVTGGTGVTGIGALPETATVSVATGHSGGTLPSASTGSAWASVTNEVLILTPVLTSFNAGSFPTVSTISINNVTNTGSLISTAALSTSTVRGLASLGSAPSTTSQTVVTATTLPTRAATTVVKSATPAHIVSTGTKSAVTNFNAGTLPSCAPQTVVKSATTGSAASATVQTLKKITGVGTLPTCAAQTVYSAISTANITNSTTTIKVFDSANNSIGALPTTVGREHYTGVDFSGTTVSFTGTPVKLNGSFSGAELTSTVSYTPAGSVGSTFSGSQLTSTAAYTPAGSINSTFSGTQSTITSYPAS